MSATRPGTATSAAPSGDPRELRVGFIGAGNLGRALAMALAASGYRVTAVASRSSASAAALAALVPGCRPRQTFQGVAEACDLVFLTTPDDAIPAVAAAVPWRRGQGVVHCAGVDSLEVLAQVRLRGALPGSFHPLQTFVAATLETPQQVLELLRDVAFAVEGSGWLLPVLERMAVDLGGRPVAVPPEQRVLYHAAAVMSCGYVAALLRSATHLWHAFGQAPEDALASLLPLARGTVDALARAGLPRGVTGPAVRGDLGTLRRHLEALRSGASHLLPLYCLLALESLGIARERGVQETRVREMEALVFEHLGRFAAAAALGTPGPSPAAGDRAQQRTTSTPSRAREGGHS